MVVAVYGASSRELDAAYLDAAFQAGAALAKRGHAMVYGAGQTGVMGAAARGMATMTFGEEWAATRTAPWGKRSRSSSASRTS